MSKTKPKPELGITAEQFDAAKNVSVCCGADWAGTFNIRRCKQCDEICSVISKGTRDKIIRQAASDAGERCAGEAGESTITESKVGPQYVAGWNDACKYLVAEIKHRPPAPTTEESD